MTAVADILRNARKLIESPENWCQGSFTTADGARCATQALAEAAPDHEANQAAVEALRRVRPPEPYSTPDWNDASTHAEVLAAFSKAIAAEEA